MKPLKFIGRKVLTIDGLALQFLLSWSSMHNSSVFQLSTTSDVINLANNYSTSEVCIRYTLTSSSTHFGLLSDVSQVIGKEFEMFQSRMWYGYSLVFNNMWEMWKRKRAWCKRKIIGNCCYYFLSIYFVIELFASFVLEFGFICNQLKAAKLDSKLNIISKSSIPVWLSSNSICYRQTVTLNFQYSILQ